MGKMLSLLWVLALTACAPPTAVPAQLPSPTAEPQPTVTVLPAPKGALTFVEFFAVN
jgi:hypothetical protein